MDGPRYKAVEGSNSAHCCFGASVIDLTTACTSQVFADWEPRTSYQAICECYSMADAERIAALLNAAPPSQEKR